MSPMIHSPNVGIAIGLTCAAGFSSTIGASVVIFPSLVKLVQKRALAAALGTAAGIMIYISFLDFFPLATESFTNAGYPKRMAYSLATATFFGGMAIMVVLDLMVKYLTRWGCRSCLRPRTCSTIWRQRMNEEEPKATELEVGAIGPNPEVLHHCMTCIKDPTAELERWQIVAEGGETGAGLAINDDMEQANPLQFPPSEPAKGLVHSPPPRGARPLKSALKKSSTACTDETEDAESGESSEIQDTACDENCSVDGVSFEGSTATDDAEVSEAARLEHVGFATFLAIMLHNFPEGLATFVATIKDPALGGVLAFAIALHNIPEGLCVAMPIYFATGNRLKAFLWGSLSGVAEPVAGILAWLVLASLLTESAFGAMYGIVAGMMVLVSVKELLPTAQRYDERDKVVTYSFIFGMVLMAITLVIFTPSEA